MIEHNSGFECDDNWDIQAITITGTDSNGNSTAVVIHMPDQRTNRTLKFNPWRQ
jgi:hypothetical protein